MNLVERMLKRPVAVVMFVFLLVFLGALAFFTRPVDLLPQISVPSLAVLTYFPNANPEKIGQTVTMPLEAVLGTLPGLKDIHSISRNDESLIVLEFDWGVNIDYRIPEIREKIRTVKLPENAYIPSVQRWDASSVPVFRFDFSGPESAHELRRLAKERIVPRIERLPGVGTVKIYGGADRIVKVEVSSRKLAAYGIQMQTVLGAIAKQNVRARLGNLSEASKTLSLVLEGRYSTPAAIGWTVIGSGRGGAVYLKDVGAISEVYEEQKEFARLDGRESVAVSVCKTRGGNTLEMIASIKDVLLKAREELPPDVKIVASRDDSTFITEAQSLVTDSLLLGSLCTMAVLFLFLRDWRSTVVVCLTIPVCMIACFIPMWYFGIGRNILSLAGLALATGMVVDSSTVMVDNMLRHRGYGRSLYDACISGAAEVKASVTASALSTIVVFLPLLYIKGFVGELFRDLAITVVGAIACSLVVVFTMTPVLYYKFSREDDRMSSRSVQAALPGASGGRAWAFLDRLGAAVSGFVESAVRWQLASIRRQVLVCSSVFAVCFAALWFAPPTGFIPTKYVSELRIEVKNPPGQSIEVSRDVVRRVEEILAAKGSIRTFSSNTSEDSSELYLKLRSAADRSGADRLVTELRNEFSGITSLDARVSKVDKVSSAVGLGKLLELKISGADSAGIASNADRLRGLLSRTPGIVNLSIDDDSGPEGLRMDVDRERAQGLGLNSAGISRMVAALLYGVTATRYERGQLDVKVTGAEEERRNIGDIMIVPDQGPGEPARGAVQIRAVSSLGKEKTLKKIERFDKKQVVTLSAGVAPGHSLGGVLSEIHREIPRSAPEAAGHYIIRGVANCLVESVSDIKFALLISLALIYMIMAAQFESLLYPLVIMTTVPLTSIGIIGGLRLAGEDLSVPALLGVIMLLGILVNSGIVIVSFMNMERGRGADISEAAFRTVRSRLKPIAITTLTTVLGMLPLALGVGAGAELYQSMAVVVIGGLLTSTFLALFMVPSMYILFEEAASYLNLLRIRFLNRGLRA